MWYASTDDKQRRSGIVPVATLCLSLLAGGVMAASPTVPLSEAPVRFAVLSDRTGGHEPGVYEQIVTEIERLKPDFVITVGDMIEGYTEDTLQLKAEWEEYLRIVEPLSMPLYWTSGNHDIYNETMAEMYRRYIGKSNYSIDHRGIHFTVLETGRWENSRELPADYIAWLESDLAAAQDSPYTFVFTHKPFWAMSTGRGRADTLHTLFKAYGVDAVFTGHYHRYFTGTYDGITYTSLGSSGGDREWDPVGPGYQFGWVTVDSGAFHIAPILMGAVLPHDTFTVEDLFRANRIERNAVSFPAAALLNEDLSLSPQRITARIRNYSLELPINDTARWEIPEGWTVAPESAITAVAPGETADVSFDISCSGSVYPAPSLSVVSPFRGRDCHPGKATLRLTRQATARRTAVAPKIDGRIDEVGWQDGISGFIPPRRRSAAAESTTFLYLHDEGNLYIAARCHESVMDSLSAHASQRDGLVHADDCVGFFLQPDPAVPTVYQVYFNSMGEVFDQSIVWEDVWYEASRNWDGEYEVATRREADRWSIEIRIPLAQFGAKTESGAAMGLNFRRKQPRLNTSADWMPIDYDPRTLGVLRFE